MKIRHFLYNAFLIEHEAFKIAIDPGQNLWLFKLRSLIPKEEWKSITHILVTHGDPDHYWHADRVAIASNSPLILNASMVKQIGTETRILVPRRGALEFMPFSGNVSPIRVGENIDVDGVRIEGILTKHGPIEYTIFGFKKSAVPGPHERTGFGSIGFQVQVGGKTIVNVGDSLLQEEWAGLNADVLMLPIGGLGNNTWTMDVDDAIEAVRIIAPNMVIPCHYSVPFFWKKKMCPADDLRFKQTVERLGVECRIMNDGDAIET